MFAQSHKSGAMMKLTKKQVRELYESAEKSDPERFERARNMIYASKESKAMTPRQIHLLAWIASAAVMGAAFYFIFR